MTSPKLSFLTFNIGNPSEQRARRQLEWLASRPEQVLVLTETKASSGCRLLAAAFTDAGWHVTYPVPGTGEYGVMILSRIHANPGSFSDNLTYLPARAASVTLPAPAAPIEIIGAYVPSRDAGLEKTERKKKWLTACQDAITSSCRPGRPVVFLGDLNILEPGHQPRYPFFAPFEYDFYQALTSRHSLIDAFRHLHPAAAEYSWVGRTGDGYRYDHAFCSADLASVISDCHYAHEPRADGLSDHSALTMTLGIQAPPQLVVTDPAAQPAAATLF
jgi:exodeoxyribonuclease-3